MTASFKIYDPDQVSISLAGIPIDGYADGEFIRVEREADVFSDVAGSNGEVARSKTNDNRGTVTFTLMQTSKTNDLLSALYNLDKNTPGGAGVGAFMCRDMQGTSIYTGANAWISKSPGATFDRAVTSREWTIRVANLIDFTGSN